MVDSESTIGIDADPFNKVCSDRRRRLRGELVSPHCLQPGHLLSPCSRHGHVVVDGEGSGDNPVADVWVSDT